MKNEGYPEEFKITISKYLNLQKEAMQKELNKEVYEFKKENPDYDVFYISFVKTGTFQVLMIIFWRKVLSIN